VRTPDAFEPASPARSTVLPPSHQQCPDRRRGSHRVVLIGAILVAFAGCGDGAGTSDAALGRTCPEFTFPYVLGQPVRGTCNQPFTIFEGHVISAVPRNDIDACTASIIDETGRYLLDHEPLPPLLGADEYGNPLVKQGCLNGRTPEVVGNFTYMTKATTGLLTFRIDAYDEGGNLLQSGLFEARPAVYPPAVPVEVSMSRQ
jgi:hypothetical protein